MLQENTLTESREYKSSFPMKNALIFLLNTVLPAPKLPERSR